MDTLDNPRNQLLSAIKDNNPDRVKFVLESFDLGDDYRNQTIYTQLGITNNPVILKLFFDKFPCDTAKDWSLYIGYAHNPSKVEEVVVFLTTNKYYGFVVNQIAHAAATTGDLGFVKRIVELDVKKNVIPVSSGERISNLYRDALEGSLTLPHTTDKGIITKWCLEMDPVLAGEMSYLAARVSNFGVVKEYWSRAANPNDVHQMSLWEGNIVIVEWIEEHLQKDLWYKHSCSYLRNRVMWLDLVDIYKHTHWNNPSWDLEEACRLGAINIVKYLISHNRFDKGNVFQAIVQAAKNRNRHILQLLDTLLKQEDRYVYRMILHHKLQPEVRKWLRKHEGDVSLWDMSGWRYNYFNF